MCASTALCLLSIPLAATASAEPARLALVIGNGAYETLPPAAACTAAAQTVAEALRGAGYGVVARTDATNGEMEAAFGEFSSRLAAAPDATAFVYVCARATAFNARPFVLPAKARLARPADVLTEGVLAKSFYDVLARGKVATAFVALDIMPLSADPKPAGFDAVADATALDGLGAVTVIETRGSDPTTPFAQLLASALSDRTLQTGTLVSMIGQRIGDQPTLKIAASRMPKAPGYLTGEPPPAAAPVPAPTPPPAAEAPSPPAEPPTAPAALNPVEAGLSDRDRRAIQQTLRRLGYYGDRIDGVFGAGTRAAIRRYQTEIGAEATGQLTAEQVGRLVRQRR